MRDEDDPSTRKARSDRALTGWPPLPGSSGTAPERATMRAARTLRTVRVELAELIERLNAPTQGVGAEAEQAGAGGRGTTDRPAARR